MDSMATYFAEHGYDVINIAYPSTIHSLEKIAYIVEKDIKNNLEQDSKSKNKNIKNIKINFVGYSMGGLVARAVLNKYKPIALGRVVQIGSPNKGSEVAEFLQDFWPYQWLTGPAGQQLTLTNNKNIQPTLGRIDYELGNIAGQNSWNFLFQGLFDGKNDGLVAVYSAIAEGSKDYIILDATHELMPFGEEIKSQVLSFLENGKFNHITTASV